MTRVWIDGVIFGAQRVGGISRYFTEILGRLRRFPGDIEVLLQVPPGTPDKSLPRGPHIERVTSPGLRPARLFLGIENRLAARRLSARKPSLFHSTYYTVPGQRTLPTVVTVYDFLHERFASMLGEREFTRRKRRVIEAAERVIVISDATREDVLRYTNCPAERIAVAYPAISDVFAEPASAQALARRRDMGITRPYVLFVGRRGQYKNFSVILHALAIARSRLDLDVVAVGGAPTLESWECDLVTRARMEDRIHLVGTRSDDELRDLYAGAAAVVVPSLGEGFGIPLVEGMAAGAQIVVSDIPVFREIAGDAAIYFDPHEPEALATALASTCSVARADSARRAGRERARRFAWDEAARVHAQIYLEVATR